MTDYLRTPDTPADTLRDTLLGALVGLARSTSSEPKTENTDAVLNAGLRLAAQPDAPAETLQRMLDITRAESTRWPQLCHLRHALRQHKGL